MSAHPEIKMKERTCLNKRRFATPEDAVADAQQRHKKRLCYVPLYVYECPYSEGEKHFHLTKHSRPIDGSGRLNVKVSP